MNLNRAECVVLGAVCWARQAGKQEDDANSIVNLRAWIGRKERAKNYVL